jgi:prevent-host-death family protein
MQVNVLDAKTNFSKLLAAVAAGDDVVIANRGEPIARIVKYEAPKVLRKPGAWSHIKQPPGYDDFSTVNAELWKQMEASDLFAGALEREAQLKAQAKRARGRRATASATSTKRKK